MGTKIRLGEVSRLEDRNESSAASEREVPSDTIPTVIRQPLGEQWH